MEKVNIDREPFYKLRKDIVKKLMKSEYRYSLPIYILFSDRAKISKFKDEKGESYFVYTMAELQKELKIGKSKESLNAAIKELEKLGLIIAKKNKGKTTRFYICTSTVNVPLLVR